MNEDKVGRQVRIKTGWKKNTKEDSMGLEKCEGKKSRKKDAKEGRTGKKLGRKEGLKERYEGGQGGDQKNTKERRMGTKILRKRGLGKGTKKTGTNICPDGGWEEQK